MNKLICPFIGICFFVALINLTGCNKSSGNPSGPFYLTFIVNGVKTICTKNLTFYIDTIPGPIYSIGMSGNNDTCSFGISLRTNIALSNGNIYTDTSNSLSVEFVYDSKAGHIYSTTGDSTSKVSFQILKISNQIIHGSFSGNAINFINNRDSGSITLGSFLIPIQ